MEWRREGPELENSYTENPPVSAIPCLWSHEQTTKALSHARFRLEKLASRLLLAQQQKDFFTQEAEYLLADLRASVLTLTSGVCGELLPVTPNSDFSEIGDKFMVLLGRNRSWSAFKVRGR